MKLAPFVAVLVVACGSATHTTVDSPPAPGGDGGSSDATDRAPCPTDQLATNVAANGDVTCATITDATAIAVRSRCQVYLGQRDSCTGCSDPPAKWSEIDSVSCSTGAGAGNACVAATLDDAVAPVELATVDLDGDVNSDDKLYTTLHCIAAPRPLAPAPCESGWAVVGKSGQTWVCAPVSEAAIGYVRTKCSVYLGWQDSCDGCTTPPAKWGFANDAGCTNGTGANDTCTTTTLGSETVNLFGLSFGGDVDGNDKIHLGFHCDAPSTGGSSSTTKCPDGQFVTGTHADGSFACTDPQAVFATYVGAHCSLFFGWHDSCDACTDVPTKWGKVSTGACANGAGADDTCTEFTLGTAAVQMFGLSPDGNVNADDTFYVGFRCTAAGTPPI